MENDQQSDIDYRKLILRTLKFSVLWVTLFFILALIFIVICYISVSEAGQILISYLSFIQVAVIFFFICFLAGMFTGRANPALIKNRQGTLIGGTVTGLSASTMFLLLNLLLVIIFRIMVYPYSFHLTSSDIALIWIEVVIYIGISSVSMIMAVLGFYYYKRK